MATTEQEDVKAFTEAVQAGAAPRVAAILAIPHVRARVNDPLFAFGQRALHVAAKNEALLTVLLDAGANVNLASQWDNGPFTVLDNTDARTARFLIARGARLTPNVAARLGWIEDLAGMLDADAALVHARGGDGKQPLHEAQTVAIADLLLDRGADIDTLCIDHKSTPAQYALVDRPDVCRRLLVRGARPDIFMAARLGDIALGDRLIESDPEVVSVRVNEPGYAPVPPMHIYCWTLGFGVSPDQVAARFGHRAVAELLASRSPLRTRFVNALQSSNETVARDILREHPGLVASLSRDDHGRLALAIFHEQFGAAALMLDAGFDPSAPGMDGGTALHAACWVGNVAMVERIIADGRIPLDARDPTHRSTPLGWAAFGSVHRRARGSDYPTVAARLVAAGADITAAGNGSGRSLVEMAEGNREMQEALRRLALQS